MAVLCLPVITVGIMVWLYMRKELSPLEMTILVAAASLTAVLIFSESRNDGRREVRQLSLTNAEQSVGVDLEVEAGEAERQKVQLKPARTASPEEKQQRLENVLIGLDDLVLGKNESFDKVEWDLVFPVSFEDPDVTVQWMTGDSRKIAWDGTLGSEIDANGEETEIRAELFLQDEKVEYLRKVTVYPSREAVVFEAGIQKLFGELNASGKGNVWLLPEEWKGQKLRWYKKAEPRGTWLCLLVLTIGICRVLMRKEAVREQEEKRLKKLQREYPNLVSRLQLYLASGLSLRKAVARLGADFPEMDKCRMEMENGIAEADAYMRFGERCRLPEYRKLALLLVQSQKKGGSLLADLLEREAGEAFENRKRQARIEGDKTAVRMILPMGAMLVVVLVVIMVPALLAF